MTSSIETWRGCYKPNGWKGVIVDAAFAHPAKFARGLLTRIYDEMEQPSRILDPFGGVALGAFEAVLRGHVWVGCELEEHFASLGNLHCLQWMSRLDARGKATLIHGDSRVLTSLIHVPFDVLLSSPPYGDCVKGKHGEVETAKHSRDLRITAGGAMGRSARFGGYGGKENLGNLDPESFWQAARRIVEQCRALLRPGAVAIWVTKDYVKKGRRVKFTQQWIDLCRSVGFVEERRVQASFIEEDGKVRKSFFRHLAEKRYRAQGKLDCIIDHEDVVFMRKCHDTSEVAQRESTPRDVRTLENQAA